MSNIEVLNNRQEYYLNNRYSYMSDFIHEVMQNTANLDLGMNADNLMNLGLCKNLVRIDGEYFLMTLPPEPVSVEIHELIEHNDHVFSDPVDLVRFQKLHPVMFHLIPNSTTDWSICISGDTMARLAGASKNSIFGIAKSIPYKGGFLPVKKGAFGFRPCLIPLTVNLEQDRSFMKENVTGSVVYGGSYQVNGKVYGQGDQAISLSSKSGVSISDTNTQCKPLQWVVWEGVLYCTQNLFELSLKNLFERGFLFG